MKENALQLGISRVAGPEIIFRCRCTSVFSDQTRESLRAGLYKILYLWIGSNMFFFMYETRTIKASSKWSMAVGSNDLILLI